MPAVVIYATKHGSTRRLAEKLAEMLGGEAVDVKDAKRVDLSKYDAVVLGSSVYVGQARKALKSYMQKNLDALKSKRLALFLCCANQEQKIVQLENAFPGILRVKALYMGALGSAVDFGKLGFLEKAVYTKATGVNVSYEAFDGTAIEALVKAVQ